MKTNSETTVGSDKPMAVSVKLVVRGIGHVPSIKNSFHSIVDPKNREWKRRCVALFVSQLFCAMPMEEFETWTLDSQPFWTALLKQSPEFDDNWKVINQIVLSGVKVEKGQEGLEITITLI